MYSLYGFTVKFFRVLLIVFDWRRGLRFFPRKSPLDVVMVSNFRDQVDVVKFGYRGKTLPDVLKWIRFHWNGIASQLFMIGVLTEDLLQREGIKKGQHHFSEAIRNPIRKGTGVVLLAANTKRIFGKNAAKLRNEFPDTIFTIGDNFTSLNLCQEVERTICITGLVNPRVLVVGPSGHLGGDVVKWLINRGYQVIGLGSDEKRAKKAEDELKIPIVTKFSDIGRVDIVVTCTHVNRSKLSAVDSIRFPGRKLVVVDVCEPPNLDQDTYKAFSDKVIRVDAGNGYSKKLKYVLEPLGYNILRLSKNMAWGCFCEAMIIAKHKDDPEVASANWLEVNETNKRIISKYFEADFGLSPKPLCFGRRVKNFSLEYKK